MTRILHIDKDDAIRFLYEEELTEEGYEVIGTSNCEGILDKIAKLNPNIIILEPKFPKVDGLDLLQSIRGAHQSMPVIISTAYSPFRYDPRSLAADYLVIKCSDLRELKLRIKMAIDHRKVFQGELIPEQKGLGMNIQAGRLNDKSAEVNLPMVYEKYFPEEYCPS